MIAKLLGYTLLSVPFVAMTVFMVMEIGWKGAALIYGGVVLLAIIVSVGADLISD